jgi:hypothetical protein
MNGNCIISLDGVENGAVRIKLNSATNNFVMNLHNKSCDPLTELGETLLQIHSYCQNAESASSFPKSFFLFWECRNYQYTIEFILLDNKELELKTSYCPDIFAGIRTENELQLTVRTEIRNLLQNYFIQLKELLLNYGFIGYKSRWQRHDFPIAMFLKLYTVLNGTEHQQTDLPCCLHYLQTIIANSINS